ncbi:hypothetical protein ABN584_26095 [Gloeocapsa sp. BRSZ]
MRSPLQLSSLRTYTIIWIGQTASLVGSEITRFALIIWIWQLTNEATPFLYLLFSPKFQF